MQKSKLQNKHFNLIDCAKKRGNVDLWQFLMNILQHISRLCQIKAHSVWNWYETLLNPTPISPHHTFGWTMQLLQWGMGAKGSANSPDPSLLWYSITVSSHKPKVQIKVLLQSYQKMQEYQFSLKSRMLMLCVLLLPCKKPMSNWSPTASERKGV